jgi:DNA end-binding protein Ku
MRKKGVVGIARVVLQRRERIVMLEPFGQGLLAMTLRYAYQVRSESAAFEDIADVQLQEELLDLAARIIETKTRSFDLTRYEDRYEDALLDLVKTKQAGRELQPVATPRPSNVINLMDALRRSIEAEKDQSRTRPGEQRRSDTTKTEPKRRAAAAATPRDKVRRSPPPKKAK